MSGAESQDLIHAPHWQVARERHNTLVQIVEQAHHTYYDSDPSQMDDANYDRLFRELENIEREHPEPAGVDSSTESTGGLARSNFAAVCHFAQMTSINGIFPLKELTRQEERVAKELGIGEFEMMTEAKIDGLVISLLYVDGRLEHAATRGGDYTGEGVSANVATIQMIPQTLSGGPFPHRVKIRGEAYTPLKDFKAFNEALEAQEEA